MSNTLDAVTPKILAMGLKALRENAIMPQLVSRKYEAEAGMKGSSIDVPVFADLSATDVVPGPTPPADVDVTPTSVSIPLDQWKESKFHLTDKELLEIMDGVVPGQLEQAAKALANTIDTAILGTYVDFYGFHGRQDGAGAYVTPFTDPLTGEPTNTQDATKMRTVLNKQLAPVSDRAMVVGPDEEGAALDLRAFQDAGFTNDPMAIIEGKINRRLGFSWHMDQNQLIHTAGSAAGETDIAVDNGAGYPVGTKTLNVDEASGTNKIKKGDIVSFAGHDQTYVCTEEVDLNGTGVDLKIEPGLQAAVVNDEAITVHPSHAVNLAFQRNAIAFATRPLARPEEGLGVVVDSMVDPVSGIALRLEVSRQYRQTLYALDVLYGVKTVRRELGARLAGAA